MEIVNLLLIEALIIGMWCWWLSKGTQAEKMFWSGLLLLFFAPISLYLVFCAQSCTHLIHQLGFLLPAIIAAGATLLTATIGRVTQLILRKKTRSGILPATLFWWSLLYCFVFIPLYVWFSSSF